MYELKQLGTGIYLLSFDNYWDLGMNFLKAQEKYESPDAKFNGKNFDLLEFIEWYAKEHGDGSFSYPNDWAGYNVPDYVLKQLYGSGDAMMAFANSYSSKEPLFPISLSKYDKFMQRVTHFISAEAKNKWYLLGCKTGDEKTLDHELSHAMYYLNPEYTDAMLNLVMADNDKFNPLRKVLSDNMYNAMVIEDECVAYISTGIPDSYKKEMGKAATSALTRIQKKFKKVFEEHKALKIK